MHRNKQVAVNVLTIIALLLATIGLIPASASITSAPQVEEPAEGVYLTKPTVKYPARRTRGGPDLPLVREDAFYSKRVAGDPAADFTMFDAAEKRLEAAAQLQNSLLLAQNQPQRVNTYGGSWTSAGPNPMVLTGRGDGTFDAMTGRIGALAIRSTPPYTMYLGGAQGGVWTLASPYTGTWTPKTDQIATPIGSIALAPSNENIIYVGTGEGELSGDSYFGNGVLKSTDGGNTFAKISGPGYFTNTSISKIVVDTTNPNIVYAATIRGRGGNRRTSSPLAAPYGVYKSTDGGVNWTAVLTVSTNPLLLSGVTDLVMDPQDSQIMVASVLGTGISRTVDGGTTWTTAMTGLPTGDYSALPTRIALGIGRLITEAQATVYAGFEVQGTGGYINSDIYKSTDGGSTWAAVPDVGNVVVGYCGTQCTYDNELGVDPKDPNIVYALGLYNYNSGSGGIYRSMNGGTSWVDLGFNLHPDYHAIAIRKDNPSILVMGNDGGVWWSASRGGRLNAGDPLTATQWSNLNGVVNPGTGGTIFRTNIQLGQYTSIATNPAIPNRFYGGFQDNGTQRKSTANNTWFDTASGDGGQVLVDPTDANYVYGTYYNISPYRFSDGAGLYLGGFTSNEYIRSGLDLNDRSEFYIPWMMDPSNSSRLYLGTQRVYRTDNAKATNASDVFWNTISTDLTSGCTGAAPNGARGCVISAFGKSAGSPALYVGTLEGWLWLAPDSTVANPAWARIDISGTTPYRPVSAIAVDASNYRVAYVGFNGFSDATPGEPGHVFKTIDAGQSWTNISSNLPDVPVNSLVIDPSDPATIYAGTDVGPYVTYNAGVSWAPLGTDFPIVTIWQLALNSFTRQLVAATHGRGAFVLTDNATLRPALRISKSTPDNPIGPGTNLVYTIKVENHGNITATNVVITDPVPLNTTFVAAGSGGTFDGSNVVFTVPQVPPPSVINTGGSLGVGLIPGSATVTFTVQITNTGVITSGDVITNDGYLARAAEGVGAVGSPVYKTLADAFAVIASPASQLDGTRAGESVTYQMIVQNNGFTTDKYNLAVSGNAFPTTLWNATMTSQITQTDNIPGGESQTIVVKVSIPANATNGQVDNTTITATSIGSVATNDSVTLSTTAVTYDVLLIDNDAVGAGNPNVSTYYTAALTAAGYPNFNYWDLEDAPANSLPLNYLKAHKVVVWFTGASYPGPLLPYEDELASFLDGGGQLFMSGMDILDQLAGTTAFVHDYLHILWDGTETQNDTGTVSASALITSPWASGLGTVPVNAASAGLVDYNDQISPIYPAEAAMLDDKGEPNALQVNAGAYKVIFLAFPLEAYGNGTQRATLIDRAMKYFASNNSVTSAPISGPASGSRNKPYTFSTTIAPITTTRPVRYYWEATGQSPVASENLSSDSVTFNWATYGSKTITLTATNEEAVVQLSGTNEAPTAVNTAASGTAVFAYNRATRELSYALTALDMSPTMAHIHRGAAGVAGPVAYTFSATPFTTTLTGVFTLSASDEALLLSDGLYVNVHSATNPAGEIRGQIHVTGGYATATKTFSVQYEVYLPIVAR